MTTRRPAPGRPRPEPARAWLAAQLRWERALERLRARHATGAGRHEERPAA